jgi:hypothetical protein
MSDLAAHSGSSGDISAMASLQEAFAARHYQRRQDMLDEARGSGARIVQLEQDGASPLDK